MEETIEEQVVEETTDIVEDLDLSTIPDEVVQEPEVEEEIIYTQYQIDAICNLTKSSGYMLNNNKLTLIQPIDEIPSMEDINILAKELENKALASKLQLDLMTLCDNLHRTIKQYISSKFVTTEQQERYSVKAQAAKDNKIEYFVDEATLLGVESEELMSLVNTMSVDWENKINLAAVKIDAVRVYLSNQITTDIGFAKFAIEYLIQDFNNITLETPAIETINIIKDKYQASLIKE